MYQQKSYGTILVATIIQLSTVSLKCTKTPELVLVLSILRPGGYVVILVNPSDPSLLGENSIWGAITSGIHLFSLSLYGRG